MIKSFSKFLATEEKTAYITMGQFNPPTIGDGAVMNTIAEASNNSAYKIFVFQTKDNRKNPLLYKEKVKYIRKMFPKHARSVIMDSKIKSPIDAAVKLFNEGYKKIVVFGEADQLREQQILFEKYNGKQSRFGFYNFENIEFVKIKNHGITSDQQIEYALNENFTSFAQGLPREVTNKDAKALFNDVRRGLGLKEKKEFKNHIQLAPVSDLREAYINDDLFKEGDEVVMHKNEVVGNIKHLGSNYVIVESKGETWRCWLNDVSKVHPSSENRWQEAPYKDPGDAGLNERTLTPTELKKREKYAKDLPDQEFKKRYGDDWKSVKIATATKMAKKEETLPDYGTPEATTRAKKITPGQNESLWANIRAKRARGERMRKKGEKGAPTQDQIKRAQGEAVSPAQQAAIAISKKERGEKPMKEYGGPPISRKEYLKQKPMQEKTPQDPDIKDREGTQPKRYHSGLKKSTKAARDAHFKKHGKKADDDPSAYKPAPGDADAKTKPSKYTKIVKKMVGEQDAVSLARKVIDRRKEIEKRRDKRDKETYDRILDKARNKQTALKNKGIST